MLLEDGTIEEEELIKVISPADASGATAATAAACAPRRDCVLEAVLL